jgi:hypothetical protein
MHMPKQSAQEKEHWAAEVIRQRLLNIDAHLKGIRQVGDNPNEYVILLWRKHYDDWQTRTHDVEANLTSDMITYPNEEAAKSAYWLLTV